MAKQENLTRIWDRQARDWHHHMGIKHIPDHYFDGIPFMGIQQVLGEALRDVTTTDEVLDAPSGANPYDYYPPFISPQQVTALDFSPGMLALNQSHVRIKANLDEPLPMPDASFNAVTSILGMRYARNPTDTLSEFVRVLQQNGTLIIVDIDRSRTPTTLVYGEQSVFSVTNTALFLAGKGMVGSTGTLRAGYPSVAYYVGRKTM